MTDATNPEHYKFSNGAETIDITENLTGNGSQAVQYIVRATRLDGNNKGDLVEDIEKAIWFCRREIQRITGDYSPQRFLITATPSVGGIMTMPAREIQDMLNNTPLEYVWEGDDEDPLPRVWRTIADVPHAVKVTDKDGDTWAHVGQWECLTFNMARLLSSQVDWRISYGPWTEVL